MSKKNKGGKNRSCNKIDWRMQVRPMPYPPYPNQWQQNNETPKTQFTDKEFLKVKRELELTEMKQQLVHAKQQLKNSKKPPVRMKDIKVSKTQLKLNKSHQEEMALNQKERVLSTKLRIKSLEQQLNDM